MLAIDNLFKIHGTRVAHHPTMLGLNWGLISLDTISCRVELAVVGATTVSDPPTLTRVPGTCSNQTWSLPCCLCFLLAPSFSFAASFSFAFFLLTSILCSCSMVSSFLAEVSIVSVEVAIDTSVGYLMTTWVSMTTCTLLSSSTPTVLGIVWG